MIREHLFHRRAPADPMFRWRGGDISRMEALADAAFALTLTLMVTSTASSQHFADLWNVVTDFPAFLMSFAMIGMCWHLHYRYFRRYGLEDTPTIVLNLALLFVVIFYAYPLQFLSQLLWDLITGGDVAAKFDFTAHPDFPLEPGDAVVGMMTIYGLGFVMVFGLFALLHLRAYRFREALGLDELECVLTRASIAQDLTMMSVGIVSILVAWTTRSPMLAGFAYWLLGPLQMAFGMHYGKQAKRLYDEISAERPALEAN